MCKIVLLDLAIFKFSEIILKFELFNGRQSHRSDLAEFQQTNLLYENAYYYLLENGAFWFCRIFSCKCYKFLTYLSQ